MYKYNTLQELFDAVYKGLAAQNFARAYDDDLQMCRYRSDSGLKCAIGNLIPDDKYNEKLEGRCGNDPIILTAASINPTLGPNVNVLQEIHDCYIGDLMKDYLRAFAKDSGLTVPEIVEGQTF